MRILFQGLMVFLLGIALGRLLLHLGCAGSSTLCFDPGSGGAFTGGFAVAKILKLQNVFNDNPRLRSVVAAGKRDQPATLRQFFRTFINCQIQTCNLILESCPTQEDSGSPLIANAGRLNINLSGNVLKADQPRLARMPKLWPFLAHRGRSAGRSWERVTESGRESAERPGIDNRFVIGDRVARHFSGRGVWHQLDYLLDYALDFDPNWITLLFHVRSPRVVDSIVCKRGCSQKITPSTRQCPVKYAPEGLQTQVLTAHPSPTTASRTTDQTKEFSWL